MKLFKMLSVVALIVLGASIARADDTHLFNNGGGSPGDPACGSDIVFALGNGFLQFNCNATLQTGPITTFSFEVADGNTVGGGLTCQSNLTNIGWTGPEGQVHNPGGVDVCTFTAPTSVSDETKDFLKKLKDPFTGKNDGDCDLDDFVLGIPVNCGIHTNNFLDGKSGAFSPFVGGAETGLGVNGALPSLPEPGTLALLLVGLTGLPFVRRKLAR